MKAKELIEKLQQLDPETLILVDGYEGDYDDVSGTNQIEVCGPFETPWYYGSYKDCEKEELSKIKAFLIRRPLKL